MLPVTMWVTPLPEITYPQVLRLLTGIGLYYSLTYWIKDSFRLRWMTNAVCAALVGLVGMGVLFVEWDPTKFPFIPDWLFTLLPSSFPGDRIHRAVMGGYLLLLMPMFISLLLFAWRKLSRYEIISYLVALFASSIVLVLTLARGAFLGFGVAVFILALLRFPKNWLVFVLFGVIIMAGASYIGWDKVIGVLNDNSVFSGIDMRMGIYQRALLIINDFPYTGIGMGTFSPVMAGFHPFFATGRSSVPHAHNLLLQIAVDLGIPGLLSWLAAFFLVFVSAWKVYRFGVTERDLWASGLGAGLLASQLGMMTQGLMDAVVWGMVRPAPLVWLVWGVIIATWNIFSPQEGHVQEI